MRGCSAHGLGKGYSWESRCQYNRNACPRVPGAMQCVALAKRCFAEPGPHQARSLVRSRLLAERHEECRTASGTRRASMNELDFSGKQVLVIGGSSGIGNGIAQAFRARAARVQVCGTRADAADYSAAEG